MFLTHLNIFAKELKWLITSKRGERTSDSSFFVHSMSVIKRFLSGSRNFPTPLELFWIKRKLVKFFRYIFSCVWLQYKRFFDYCYFCVEYCETSWSVTWYVDHRFMSAMDLSKKKKKKKKEERNSPKSPQRNLL